MLLVGVKAGGAHLSLLCCVTPQAEGVTGAPRLSGEPEVVKGANALSACEISTRIKWIHPRKEIYFVMLWVGRTMSVGDI